MNDSVILKLEKLARIQLDDASRSRLGADLQKMLHMVDKLQELDTANVEPLVYMNEEHLEPASDIAEAPLPQQTALKNAPQKNESYFLVPKVIN